VLSAVDPCAWPVDVNASIAVTTIAALTMTRVCFTKSLLG
jgi:hypothetical protein